MMALLDKSEKWWIVNFEIPTNPDFDDKVIGKSDIIPGPLVGMRMLLDIALGSEEESKLYWEEYKKRFPNT